MSIGPRWAVPADLLAASRPPFNLLDAPGVLWAPDDPHWVNGISAEPDKCSVPLDIDNASSGDFPYWWQCEPAGGQSAVSALTTKIIADGRGPISIDAFTVWVGYLCSPQDLNSDLRRAEVEKTLRRSIEVVTRIAVERELSTGQITRRSRIEGSWLQKIPMTATVNGAGRTGFVSALGELEQLLADNGNMSGRRYIHAQPRVVNAWASRGLVQIAPDGTFLRTTLGTIVVPGVGYTGGAPGDENSSGSMNGSWAYGTGPIKVAVGELTPISWGADSLDRPNNEREVRIEREVAIVWDPCVKVAAFVNPCDEYCGTGS